MTGLQSVALPLGDLPRWQIVADLNCAPGCWRPWMPPGHDLYEKFVQSRQSGPSRLRADMVVSFVGGGDGEDRTHDFQGAKLALSRLSYVPARLFRLPCQGASSRRVLLWRGVRDSNPQPPGRQPGALPIAPTPRRYRERNLYRVRCSWCWSLCWELEPGARIELASEVYKTTALPLS